MPGAKALARNASSELSKILVEQVRVIEVALCYVLWIRNIYWHCTRSFGRSDGGMTGTHTHAKLSSWISILFFAPGGIFSRKRSCTRIKVNVVVVVVGARARAQLFKNGSGERIVRSGAKYYYYRSGSSLLPMILLLLLSSQYSIIILRTEIYSYLPTVQKRTTLPVYCDFVVYA